MAVNPPGRHRAPGRYNPLAEFRAIAKESAQPAFKGAAIVAASGGLIATIAPSASAAENAPLSAKAAAAPAIAPAVSAPAAVGPIATTAPLGSNALSAIGFATPTTTTKAAATAPRVIEDVVVQQARAAAKARAAAEAARASRSLSRQTLTNSTSTTKPTTNYYGGASVGIKSGSNWATWGQCTWGALEKWHAYTGYYLGGFYGNALDWGWKARNAGWTVTSTPRANSIVVLQPGVYGSSSAGHVAWVTSVSGNSVTVVEMNALAGLGAYDTRTLTNVSGMQYILAP